MTPDPFIIEVEELLIWKNANRQNWLFLVSRMLKKDSDISRWWRETKASVHSWDEFKAAFMKYEKSGQNKDDLLSKLFAKKQHISDAFETFAWDVNGHFRRILISK